MVLKKRRNSISIVIGVLLLFISSAIFSCLLILFWPQGNPHSLVKVRVEPGSSLNKIAENLYKESVISNVNMFCFAVKMLGKEKEIPVGTFKIINATNNKEIINQLIYGAPEFNKVRILEGWNIKQIAGHLSSVMNFDSTNFIQLTNDKKILQKHGIKALSLEGYLYPDTYFFNEGDSPEFVLNHLIKSHKSIWNESLLNRAEALDLNPHEIVTLASIIEGEAIYDIERPRISAVYHNRLNIGMRLQADPTIQFIIPDSPRRLLNRDLKIKSPYNTYLNQGLPPGPINSPGKNSILAALFPEKNDFLFFVASGDGYHTFTTNEKDHNRAKRKLQRLRRALKRKKK